MDIFEYAAYYSNSKYKGIFHEVVTPNGQWNRLDYNNNLVTVGESYTDLKDVIIPDGVKYIKKAFTDDLKEKLITVTMPDSVIKTQDIMLFDTDNNNGIFYDCKNLEYIKLSKNLERLGNFEFKGCSKLPKIIIPDSVKEIAFGAFEGCSRLSFVKLPEHIEYIAESLFRECSSLKEITIPDEVKEIRDFAFFNCTALESIILPEGLKTISENAFIGCSSLRKIQINGELSDKLENELKNALAYLNDDASKIQITELSNDFSEPNNAEPEISEPKRSPSIEKKSNAQKKGHNVSKLQEAIDSTPENGILNLEPGIYKGSFTVDSQITIRGAGYSTDDGNFDELGTIIIVPEDESIVIRNAATIEGVIFVGHDFYVYHKKALNDEIIPCQVINYKDHERNKKISDILWNYSENLKEYSTSNDRNKLYEIAENEMDNSLLQIEADDVVLRKVCVVGSPSNGIIVDGKAEFSCVCAIKNQFTNLVVKTGAEVTFTSTNEKALLTNCFSYSLKAWGIHCSGKIFFGDNEAKKEICIWTECNMLQGIHLSGQINANDEANSNKEFTGIVRAHNNYGNGFGMYEKAIANLNWIDINENSYTGLVIAENALLNVKRIDSCENGTDGIALWGNSNLNVSDFMGCCANKEDGIIVGDKANLSAGLILLSENHGEFGGLCVQDDATAEIESFEAFENRLGFFATDNAKLKISYEECKVYDNEKGHCKLEGNAVAEFTNVSFFHEAEESGYIPMADDSVGKIFASENARADFTNCYFYNCPSEEYVIYANGAASLNFDSCHFGIKPEQGIYDLNDTKIHGGICASGNASITLTNTKDVNCELEHFIKADKSVQITDDDWNDQTNVKRT